VFPLFKLFSTSNLEHLRIELGRVHNNILVLVDIHSRNELLSHPLQLLRLLDIHVAREFFQMIHVDLNIDHVVVFGLVERLFFVVVDVENGQVFAVHHLRLMTNCLFLLHLLLTLLPNLQMIINRRSKLLSLRVVARFLVLRHGPQKRMILPYLPELRRRVPQPLEHALLSHPNAPRIGRQTPPPTEWQACSSLLQLLAQRFFFPTIHLR
jgi:hypothetical protein